MIFKILALGALAVAATASPAPSAWSWNELVGAENLFHPEIDSIQSKSIEPTVVVSELTELLGQPKVLAAVYKTYLTQYKKEESRMSDPQPQAKFKQTLIEIAEHNLGAKLGQYKWFEGVNLFTDMSDEEYKKYLTYSISFEDFFQNSSNPIRARISDPLPTQAPSAIDWVAKGMVTKIRDQGQCGSCYAFSAIGQLESCALIKGFSNKDELDLSEQQVVDCSNNYGCDGGGLANTNEYLQEGVATEAAYGAYTQQQGECNTQVQAAGPKVDAGSIKSLRSESALKTAVAKGPANIAVDAGCSGFQRYKTGILTSCSKNLNHAVLAVGYGNEKSTDTWLVKNSWGTGWGKNGYIVIQRGKSVAGIGNDGTSITCSI